MAATAAAAIVVEKPATTLDSDESAEVKDVKGGDGLVAIIPNPEGGEEEDKQPSGEKEKGIFAHTNPPLLLPPGPPVSLLG